MIIILTKIVDYTNTRPDKKVGVNLININSYEEVANGNGCTKISLNGTTDYIVVRETFDELTSRINTLQDNR